MKRNSIIKYFLLVLFLISIIISFIIIKPFITPIIASIILAFLFYPIYKKVLKIVKNKSLSSTIMLLIIILIILIPFLFIASAILQETVEVYSKINELDLSPLSAKYKEIISGPIDLTSYLSNAISSISGLIVDSISSFLFSLPKRILDLFILLFLLFYFFKDGDKIISSLNSHLPLKKEHKEKLLSEFKGVSNAIIYGSVISGLAQGVVGAIGFYLFKIPNPLLWGMVMAILGIFPIIGPPLIWVPAGLYIIATGDVFRGVALLVYGFFIISTIDNIMKPHLISSKTKIHPTLIFLGLIGGIALFGIIGIIIGPLILSLLTLFIKIYSHDNTIEKNNQKVYK